MISRSYGTTPQRAVYSAPRAVYSPPPTSGTQGAYAAYDPEAPRKPQGSKPRIILTTQLALCLGLGALALVVTIPVADSVIMLTDFNFLFWNGPVFPSLTIAAYGGILIAYALVIKAMGSSEGNGGLNVQALGQIATTFPTLVAVTLVLTSLYLYYKEQRIVESLTYDCRGADIPLGLRHTYASLRTLRSGSECTNKLSVEECRGYKHASDPYYSSYLKALEENYACSGLCDSKKMGLIQHGRTDEHIEAIQTSNATSTRIHQGLRSGEKDKKQGLRLDETDKGLRSGEKDKKQGLRLDETDKALQKTEKTERTVTKTTALTEDNYLQVALFSQGRYKTSCNGAVARRLTFGPVTVTRGWWWYAISLIILSLVVGTAEWIFLSK